MAHKTINRGTLLKKAHKGLLVMVGSYHYDDMGGERSGGKFTPVRIRHGRDDWQEGVCGLWESDFRSKSGCAYENADGTITLIVHSNCNYTLREIAADQPLDPRGYAFRVAELESEGLTTSDAQGVADVEFGKVGAV